MQNFYSSICMELFYHRASKRTMCYRFLFFSILILFLFLIFSFQNLLVYEKPFYSTSIPSVFSNFDGIAKAISFLSVFMKKNIQSEFSKYFQAYFWISFMFLISSCSYFISKTFPSKYVSSPKCFWISFLLWLNLNSVSIFEEFNSGLIFWFT